MVVSVAEMRRIASLQDVEFETVQAAKNESDTIPVYGATRWRGVFLRKDGKYIIDHSFEGKYPSSLELEGELIRVAEKDCHTFNQLEAAWKDLDYP